MRPAFGLPQALLIILFIGGIVTVTMRYAGLGAKHYADSYTREQAELFMQSATETALLRISGYDRTATGGCLKNFTVSLPSDDGTALFDANVTINRYYLYQGLDNGVNLSGCDRVVAIETPESHGMVDMSIVVTSNQDNPKILHPVKLVRRSLQRP